MIEYITGIVIGGILMYFASAAFRNIYYVRKTVMEKYRDLWLAESAETSKVNTLYYNLKQDIRQALDRE